MPARVRAPEPVGRGGWIGPTEPLSLAALRGKVVLIHFWASSCVACLRLIEEIRPLDDLFAEELVIVGVHSPRFPGEAEHEAVVTAVARHGIAHPVLDDPDRETMGLFGARQWPTAVLVDPRGYEVGRVSGPDCGGVLQKAVAEMVERHSAAKRRFRRSLIEVARAPLPHRPLAFPAKVACSADGRYLAIADTGHDRVLVTTVDGVVLEAHTGFLQPHGVRFDGAGVVVCDTGADRVVRTDGEVLADSMASPWDLVSDGRSWVVAEAGGHRLLRVRPGELRARLVAGSGAEGMRDGPDIKAELAQPAGVARTAEGIAFVDSASSALRLVVEDRRGGNVSTLVGQGSFECGDEDGPGGAARLQYPQGVASQPGGGPVFVADTLNSLLRVWQDGVLRTLPVRGLNRPGGLDLLPDGRLVVADTDNHRIVVVDPATGEVRPVELDETWVHGSDGPAVHLTRGQRGRVDVAVELVDEDLERSDGPPVRVLVESRPAGLVADGPAAWSLQEANATVEVVGGNEGAGMLLVEVTSRTRGSDGVHTRVQRRRHPLQVTAR